MWKTHLQAVHHVVDVGAELGVARAADGDAVEAAPLEELGPVDLADEEDLVDEGLQELEEDLHHRLGGA
jgi:hypothetical protein